MLGNKVYWTMRDGNKIDIDKMDITHLRNTLKMLVRAEEARIRKLEAEGILKSWKVGYWPSLNGDMAQMSVDMEITEEMRDEIDFEDNWVGR
jgi:hypothetical protein